MVGLLSVAIVIHPIHFEILVTSLYNNMKRKSIFILTSLKTNGIIIVISLTMKEGIKMADIMTVRAPDKLKEILSQEAKCRGTPRNALILQILWEWVKNNKSAS